MTRRLPIASVAPSDKGLSPCDVLVNPDGWWFYKPQRGRWCVERDDGVCLRRFSSLSRARKWRQGSERVRRWRRPSLSKFRDGASW